MPKTRNVTRSQWDAAKTSTTTSTTKKTTSRKRNENENKGYDSEKENLGRQAPNATRLHSRARARAGLGVSNPNIPVLGATTTTNLKTAAKGKTASKGKGVPPSGPVKRKKMPLEDITAEFLPAPEALNRGELTQEESVADDAPPQDEMAVNVVVATAPPPEPIPAVVPPTPKFNSPLPPSSPPSELIQSPRLPQPSAPQFYDNFDAASSHSIPQATFDPWQEFDDANLPSYDEPKNVSSNSDPFGFVALERKLKADREAALLMAPDCDFDDADQILEADTSSPRPVRRLKRSSSVQDEEAPEETAIVIPHPHFATPPTPHKDHKRRRMSHPGHDIFSPCTSSVESSPSPTKASSSRKRPQQDMGEDPLDQYNEEVDRSYTLELASKKAKVDNAADEEADAQNDESSIHLGNSILQSLRPREKRRSVDIDAEQGNKRAKKPTTSQNTKKSSSKSRSATTKTEEKELDNEEDLDAVCVISCLFFLSNNTDLFPPRNGNENAKRGSNTSNVLRTIKSKKKTFSSSNDHHESSLPPPLYRRMFFLMFLFSSLHLHCHAPGLSITTLCLYETNGYSYVLSLLV